MRKLPVSLLRPGMKVGRTIYNSDGKVLLNVGKVISENYISRLRSLGIPAIYIEDGILDDVEINDIVADETRTIAKTNIKKIHTKTFEGLKKGKVPDIDGKTVSYTIEKIIDDILNKKDLMVNLSDIRTLDDYTFAHSVNVCILSLLTGISLGYNKNALMCLGTGALLHDIGKTKVPIEILNKPGKLTEEEFQEIKNHSIYGFDILRQQEDISVTAAHIAYEHHERYNGEGYPRQLKGSSIHEFAQVTGMVDVYDALVSDRVYRGGFLPHEALEMITGSGNFLFDYELVKTFTKNIAAYPTGTTVELNTGEIGIVIGTPKWFPSRPDVRLIQFKDNKINTIGEIHLSENTNLLIKRVIPEEEFANYYGMDKVIKL
ncbi:MAG: HD-GYP domain-containing protein [bacterium]